MLDELARRTRQLAAFVVGLGHYANGDYEQARQRFRRAIDGRALEAGGIEVLYLSLGNSNSKLGRHGRARRAYESALAVSPQYARARIGLAEVMYLTAAGDCGGRTDPAGLQRAERQFAAAAEARVQPSLAAVQERAAFGLARIDVCRTVAGLAGRADDARRRLRDVIASYESGQRPRVQLRELAAESHAHLGLLAVPMVDAVGREDALARALTHYRRAAELSVDPARSALHWGSAGRLAVLRGDGVAALHDYRRALDARPAADRRAQYRCMVDALADDRPVDEGHGRRLLAACAAPVAPS
jgi:tetratricopeptide (TPR) repeat protein